MMYKCTFIVLYGLNCSFPSWRQQAAHNLFINILIEVSVRLRKDRSRILLRIFFSLGKMFLWCSYYSMNIFTALWCVLSVPCNTVSSLLLSLSPPVGTVVFVGGCSTLGNQLLLVCPSTQWYRVESSDVILDFPAELLDGHIDDIDTWNPHELTEYAV